MTGEIAATAEGRITGEIAAMAEGRITGLRCHVLADHGAFDACADPTKYSAGFFSICTGSYDIPVGHVTVDGVYTNKAPGGVATACFSLTPKQGRASNCRSRRGCSEKPTTMRRKVQCNRTVIRRSLQRVSQHGETRFVHS